MKKTTPKFWLVTFASVALLSLSGCGKQEPVATAQTETAVNDTRETLESAAEDGSVAEFIASMRERAAANVTPQPLSTLVQEIAPHLRWYQPDSDGQHPVLIFMHGCSGATLSHEEDWAARVNSAGVSLLAVDSYGGRGLEWEEVCNFEKMTPWQRSGDVHASIAYLAEQPNVDMDNIYLAGFSHGAMSVWAFLEQASSLSPSIGLQAWPETNLEAVKAAFMFYGGCAEPWTVDIDAYVFLGGADRYIEPDVCEPYQAIHSPEAGELKVVVYPEATHTFDHSRPNQANVEAGSLYDAAATEDVWRIMSGVFASHQ